MNLKQKLLNPFALGAQGFVAAALLMWATAPADTGSAPVAAHAAVERLAA